jgi:superfamily II DNA or RNA helicase
MSSRPKDILTPGVYSKLIDGSLAKSLNDFDGIKQITKLDKGESHRLLTDHVSKIVEQSLKSLKGDDSLTKQINLVNKIISLIVEDVSQDSQMILPEELTAIGEYPQPGIPLNSTELLVNARSEQSVGVEIQSELASADRVDLICAFLKWSGYMLMKEAIVNFIKRKGASNIRIITTVYMGATEQRVLDDLQSLGAQVRVSLEQQTTRLHAKAWLFHRDSGYDTCFIGSSNMSAVALQDGQEWNVRVSGNSNKSVVKKFSGTFDSYWESVEYLDYSKENVQESFAQIITAHANKHTDLRVLFDIHPYPYQEEILEALYAARTIGNRNKNLLIAATGTGKTVVAAFDYQRLVESEILPKDDGRLPSLLFIAHQRRILEQAQATFRNVLSDKSFGELFVGGERPSLGRHVFASVQSLGNHPEIYTKQKFDMVIVDEAHHSSAPSYLKILERLEAKQMLFMTATPERTDGVTIQEYFFNGQSTAEIRLWDAIDRGQLCPFSYFGLSDGTDLSRLKWSAGGYDIAGLDGIYTGNDARSNLILKEIVEHVSDIHRMRALGFCVSVKHAQYMARKFNEAGVPSVAIHGNSTQQEREAAISDLKLGSVSVIFVVDLFNEGVDIPELDTLLLLRPTDSPVLFQQQLGRGLRHCKGKHCLTVLDFIGQSHKKFSWESRIKPMLASGAGSLSYQVQNKFPLLPAGCSYKLDEKSSKVVLENIKSSTSARDVIKEEYARDDHSPMSLLSYLNKYNRSLGDVYSKSGDSWVSLVAEKNGWGFPQESSKLIWEKMIKLVHLNDPSLIENMRRELADNKVLATTLCYNKKRDVEKSMAQLQRQLANEPSLKNELNQMFDALRARRDFPVYEVSNPPHMFKAHATYFTDQIATMLGVTSPREGVYYDKKTDTDLLFVTINKSEKEYSPTTMYDDFAISSNEFQWDSQSKTKENSATGKRYAHTGISRNPALLFVREKKKQNGMTSPYICLGHVRYTSHTGESPMAIKWKLDIPIPQRFIKVMKIAR